MTDPKAVTDIVEGVAGILAIFGIPVAIFVAPITSIIGGVFGLKKKR